MNTRPGDRGHHEVVNASEHQHEASTRDRLHAAALELVAEKGVAAGVGEIARRAGLTTGAVYSTYRTKDELIAAALLEQHERLFHDALGRAADRSASFVGTLVEVLSTEATIEHRALLEAIVLASRDPELRVRLEASISGRNREVIRLLEAARAGGQLAPDVDVASLSYVLHLVGLGNMVAQVLGTPAPSRANLDRTIGRLAEGFVPESGRRTSHGP
jgi:AcrR family transcriptional regulator